MFQGGPYFLCTEGRLFLKFQCKDMDFLYLPQTNSNVKTPWSSDRHWVPVVSEVYVLSRINHWKREGEKHAINQAKALENLGRAKPGKNVWKRRPVWKIWSDLLKVPTKDNENEPQRAWEILLRKETIIPFNQTRTVQEVIPRGAV